MRSEGHMRGKRGAMLVAAAVLTCAVADVTGSSNAATTMGSWRITSVWGAGAAFESVVDVGPGKASFSGAGEGGRGAGLVGRHIWEGPPAPHAGGGTAPPCASKIRQEGGYEVRPEVRTPLG